MALGHWLKNFTKWYFDPGAWTGGGGGGSSDFRTATVTIVNNTSTEIACDGAWLITGEENEKLTKPSLSLEGNDSITSTIIIVDLGASIFIHPALFLETTDALSCTTTGSVIDFGYGTLRATGDCTITLESI